MMYPLSLLLSLALGYLSLKLILKQHKITGPLLWILSLSLGLGLNGCLTFIIHLIVGWHQPWAPLAISLALSGVLFLLGGQNIILDKIQWKDYTPGLILLSIIALFALCEAMAYPLGGWDAWSCWNLKAKFIYLGREHWKDMLDPLLWRSNTQYPLLLPCINVFFWDLQGYAAWVPMLNSILFMLCSAGILLFGLYEISKQWLLPIALTASCFLIPFNITLGISQYSDILLGLYLIAAFILFLNDELLACALCIGLLSFTKTEGTVAALLLSAGLCLFHLKTIKQWGPYLLGAALPTIIFTFFMAPHNEAFINGLTSALKPSTLERLQITLVLWFYEFISPKWHGIWILLLAGVIACWKKAFEGKMLLFALFIAGYMGIILMYYEVNTFFEISWWVTNTLNRLIFALLPSALLWLGLAL